MSHPLVPDNRLLARRPDRSTLLLALLAAVALVAGLFTAYGAASTPAHAAGKTAKVTVSKVTAKAAKVTVKGKVTLPSKVKGKTFKNTAKNRKAVKVRVTLRDSAGKTERVTASIKKNRSYTVSKTTKLGGKLTVTAQTRINGKASGKTVTKRNAVTIAPAKVTIGSVTLANERDVTVTGAVTLPANLKNTAANRKKVTVALTLADLAGTRESFTTTINNARKYTATKSTALVGPLTATATVRVSGKTSGATATRANAVSVDTEIPAGARKLNGLFRFDAGQDNVVGQVWGTYFRMSSSSSSGWLVNQQSTARDTTYTLLRPGTDGGLSTVEYQEPPDPPFAYRSSYPLGENPHGFDYLGNSLANRITQPQSFFAVDFSITTAPIDAQWQQVYNVPGLDFTYPNRELLGFEENPTPLPEIWEKDGQLYGQVTGWTANWNGAYFNQGTPKPAGTDPDFPATPLTGTYDAETGKYTLHWTSRIYTGAFNGFWGHWFLEGTFEPAAE